MMQPRLRGWLGVAGQLARRKRRAARAAAIADEYPGLTIDGLILTIDSKGIRL